MSTETPAKSKSLDLSGGKAAELDPNNKSQRASSPTTSAIPQTPESTAALLSPYLHISQSQIIPGAVMASDPLNDFETFSSDPSPILSGSWAEAFKELNIDNFVGQEMKDESDESDADDEPDEEAMGEEETYIRADQTVSDLLDLASIKRFSEMNIGTNLSHQDVDHQSKSPFHVPSPNFLQTPYGKQMAAGKISPPGPMASTSYVASNTATATGMYAKYANQVAGEQPSSHTTRVSAFSHVEVPKTLEELLNANRSSPKFGQATGLGPTRRVGLASDKGAQISTTSSQERPEASPFAKWYAENAKTFSFGAAGHVDQPRDMKYQPIDPIKKPGASPFAKWYAENSKSFGFGAAGPVDQPRDMKYQPIDPIKKPGASLAKWYAENSKSFGFGAAGPVDQPRDMKYQPIDPTQKPNTFAIGQGMVKICSDPVKFNGGIKSFSQEPSFNFGAIANSGKPFAFGGKGENIVSVANTNKAGSTMEMSSEEVSADWVRLSSLAQVLPELDDFGENAGVKDKHFEGPSTMFQHGHPNGENGVAGVHFSRTARREGVESSQALMLVDLSRKIDELREQVKTLTSENARAQGKHAKVLEEKIGLEERLKETQAEVERLRLSLATLHKQ